MSLSISNFKNSSNSKNRAQIGALVLFGCTFVFLSGAWPLVARAMRWSAEPIVVQVKPPSDDSSYIGYFNGTIEDYVIYNGLEGAAEALRHADVLFLGNSRSQYAFRDLDVLDSFFRPRGLRYFVLAFPLSEGQAFPESIIHKFNLHPKWVVVNADPFFGKPATEVASRAMAYGPLEARKLVFETNAALAVQRRMHRIFPYLALSEWDGSYEWIYYRGKNDGALRLAAWRGSPRPADPVENPTWAVTQTWRIQAGERFKNDLNSRGARLVLTWIPPDAGAAARPLAEALQLPLITPLQTGLITIDGSHLDAASAHRFCAAFVKSFGAILDGGEGTRQP